MAGVAIGLVCGALGYWWAMASQRRAAGGKSVAELSAEKEQYQQDVVEHFKTSADLLNEMTDKYRDVYRHMAEGAQRLVPGDNVAPALAALQSGLLAAPGAPAREATIEPPSAEDVNLSSDVSAEEITESDSVSADLAESTPDAMLEAEKEDELGEETHNDVVEQDLTPELEQSAKLTTEPGIQDNTSVSATEDEARNDFFADDTDEIEGGKVDGQADGEGDAGKSDAKP
jgi:uncharacterized protein